MGMNAVTYKEWMENNGISVIDVNRGTDIHPTTIYRFLEGKDVNPSTRRALEKFKEERERVTAVAG